MKEVERAEAEVKEGRRVVFNAIVAPLARGPITARETTELLDSLINAVRKHDAEIVRSMEDGVVRMSGRRVTDVDLVAELLTPKKS